VTAEAEFEDGGGNTPGASVKIVRWRVLR